RLQQIKENQNQTANICCCDGKKTYELSMKELHTSDPCPTVSKYLETDYICVRATHKTICEGSTVQIKCGRRQLIFILGAYFGRQDKKTCSKGRPESEIQNCDCSKSVTDIVAHNCNGGNSCNIEVSTKVLTDPCTGTYKYLELAYECQSKKTSP
uniref:SUEL-type lectin domain-containing protein n=1 Tax=Nothobranchius furzeri TaxID=105023 RepID=A0A8C6LYS5_NOTFU